MSHHRTSVWVKTSLLNNALVLSGEEPIIEADDDDSWDWCHAILVEGNLKLQDDLTLQIDDDAISSYSAQTIVVPRDLIHKHSNTINQTKHPSKGSKKQINTDQTTSKDSSKNEVIVMANDFSDTEGNLLPPEDLITLTHLHEPALVYSLRKRFEERLVYTATGAILLAVNPFEEIDGLYDEMTMNRYFIQGDIGSHDVEFTLPPHVFGTTDKAFRNMKRGLDTLALSRSRAPCNQSILVSGESGAGKTVSTKYVMQYLSALSRRKSHSNQKSMTPRRSSRRKSTIASSRVLRTSMRKKTSELSAVIEQKILESNPILESFGNARTVRNDNSSRYGKFIELQFERSGSLIGAKIKTYLLEKVRLVSQGEDERNFHIFYELLAGSDSADREACLLDQYTAEDFLLTSQSGVFDRRDMVDDLEQFENLGQSMLHMGFAPDIVTQINSIISALLHASNVTFMAISDDETEIDVENPCVASTLTLLGLEVEAFSDALCAFYIQVGKERHRRSQPKRKAEKGLEAFMKAIYSALFDYLVEEINGFIYDDKKGKNVAAFIGVLDIFGFESFKSNSFEQLCINYCNESLQQQFNMHVFKEEQTEYKKEGINWSYIDFPDNEEVLHLIDKNKLGIIAILDDHCKAPNTTDKAFASQLYKLCKKHPRFEADFRQVGSGLFDIIHYTGPVEYNTVGFIEKNRDEVPRETIELLKSSSNQFVVTLLNYHQQAIKKTSSSFRNSRINVGHQFKLQLQALRERIDQTYPHYIRCLKPNSALEAGTFNSQMISNQLRSAGVLEAIRVSRIGYPQRYSHDMFIRRYSILSIEQTSSAKFEKMIAKQKCEALIQTLVATIFDKHNLSDNDVQLGSTKVFLRQNASDELEYYLAKKLMKSAVCIQKTIRMFVLRSIFLRIIKATVCIQSYGRRYVAIKFVESVRRNHAAISIQKYWRSYNARFLFKNILSIALWCQKNQKGRSTRKKYRLKEYHDATVKIQCFVRLNLFHSPKPKNNVDESEEKSNENIILIEDEVIAEEENAHYLSVESEMKSQKLEEENENLKRRHAEIEKQQNEAKMDYDFELTVKDELIQELQEQNEHLQRRCADIEKQQREAQVKYDEEINAKENVIKELQEEIKYLRLSSLEMLPKLNEIQAALTSDLATKDQQLQQLQAENEKSRAKSLVLEQKLTDTEALYESELAMRNQRISEQLQGKNQIQRNPSVLNRVFCFK